MIFDGSQPKICNQNNCKWKETPESHVETCIGWASFNFAVSPFFCNLPIKIIICCFKDKPSITWYWRSVLNVLSFNFSEVYDLLDERQEKYVQRENVSTQIYIWCDETYWFQAGIGVYLVWPQYSNFKLRNLGWKSSTQKLVQVGWFWLFIYNFLRHINMILWLSV